MNLYIGRPTDSEKDDFVVDAQYPIRVDECIIHDGIKYVVLQVQHDLKRGEVILILGRR